MTDTTKKKKKKKKRRGNNLETKKMNTECTVITIGTPSQSPFHKGCSTALRPAQDCSRDPPPIPAAASLDSTCMSLDSTRWSAIATGELNEKFWIYIYTHIYIYIIILLLLLLLLGPPITTYSCLSFSYIVFRTVRMSEVSSGTVATMHPDTGRSPR